MATLNVSNEQKEYVVNVQTIVNAHLGAKLSQAQIVQMGMALLEERYGSLPK